MIEVVPGIFQAKIPLPGFALQYINVYLVRGNGGWLLVDCGWNTPEAFTALEESFRELHISFRDISQIVVTHIHPDHYGLAGRLQKLSGCRLAMHRTEAALIQSRYIWMDKLLGDIGEFLTQNGAPPEETAILKSASLPVLDFVANALPDIILDGGEIISAGKFKFEVMCTPGHSPAHICLYEPSLKLLLAGDHILPVTTPHVGFHPQQQGNPLADYLHSLQTIDQLDVALVLPGHEQIFSNFHSRIKELLVHHKRRGDEVLQLVSTKAKTAYGISPQISWVTSNASWQNLPALDRRLAVMEALAHLEYLRHQGKLQKHSENGITFYQQA